MKSHKVPQGKLITIASFSNYIEANITAAYLRQHGIDCFLVDENSTACAIATSVVETRLMISIEDCNHAKIILNSYPQNYIP